MSFPVYSPRPVQHTLTVRSCYHTHGKLSFNWRLMHFLRKRISSTTSGELRMSNLIRFCVTIEGNFKITIIVSLKQKWNTFEGNLNWHIFIEGWGRQCIQIVIPISPNFIHSECNRILTMHLKKTDHCVLFFDEQPKVNKINHVHKRISKIKGAFGNFSFITPIFLRVDSFISVYGMCMHITVDAWSILLATSSQLWRYRDFSLRSHDCWIWSHPPLS